MGVSCPVFLRLHCRLFYSPSLRAADEAVLLRAAAASAVAASIPGNRSAAGWTEPAAAGPAAERSAGPEEELGRGGAIFCNFNQHFKIDPV